MESVITSKIVDVVTKDGRTVQVDLYTPANWKQQLRGTFAISEQVFKMLSLPAYDYRNPQPTDLVKLHKAIANRARKVLSEYAQSKNSVVTKKMVNNLISENANDTKDFVIHAVVKWLTSPKSKKISTLNLHYLIGQEKTEFSSSLGFDSAIDDKLTEKKVVTVEPVAEPVAEPVTSYESVMADLQALKNESVEVEPVEIVEPIESVELDEVSDLLDGLSPAALALLKNKLNNSE